MSELSTRIQAAIKAALPEHLSQELQSILHAGDQARARVEQLVEANTKLMAEVTAHKVLEGQRLEVIKREGEVTKREHTVLLRELKAELNEFKVAAAEQRTKDLKDVTLAVFANSQFKYERMTTGYQNVAVPAGSCLMGASTNSTETIKTEGG